MENYEVGQATAHYSANGTRILKYSVEIKHNMLNEYRVISAPDLSMLQHKVNSQVDKWEEKWEKLTEKKEKEMKLSAPIEEAKNRTIEAQQASQVIENLLKYTLDIDDAIDLPKNPKETLATYESYPETHWNHDSIVKEIKILKNAKMLNVITELKSDFIQDVIYMKLNKEKFIIYNKEHNAYVLKVTKRIMYSGLSKGFAKQFTKIKAEDILKSYNKDAYEIQPVES
ncbi:MAG: hypothetical protein P9L97_11020 [Candidatus Tenebribacter davisii]|jgi:restriction system protein|nr:hypothetical protein [Candidatus Tenebribacter davisii]